MAFWDSSKRSLAHWKFGHIEASSASEALSKVLPYARLEEARRGHGGLKYDYDGDLAIINVDKGEVLMGVLRALGDFDLEEQDLGGLEE